MTILDVDFIRDQFPTLNVPDLQGRAFFENAGGSFTCRQVQDRLFRFYRERKMQPYAPYPPSSVGGAEMDEARSRLAALMNVETDEVSFGPSTTQNTYVLSQAVRQWLRPGQAIVVTNQDHEANSGPWRRLADAGINVREWQINPDTGLLEPHDLESLLDENVRLVVFPHCSNVIGAINPVKSITRMAKSVGAHVCIDGVSYAPHGLPDVADIGADIYLFSAYKTYGPHQGIMVIRRDFGMELPNQGHHFNAGSLEKRFTPAGPDHAQVAACAGIADYIDAVHDHHFETESDPATRGRAVHNLFRETEVALLQPFLDYLKDKNSLRLLGPSTAQDRAPTVALLHQRRGEDLCAELADHGIMAGGGDFYGQRPIEALGIDPDHGVLRLSFVHYTTKDEMLKLQTALEKVL